MDAKENTLFIAVVIIAAIVVLIMLYFFIAILRRQRKSIRLYTKGIADEIEQIEKERSRIAADLHDELSPILSAVKMRISSLELSNDGDKFQIQKTNEHITDIMQRLRQISFDLMPDSLLRKGLVPAVKEYLDSLNAGPQMKFYFSCTDNPPLDEYKCINTYRIIQEIIQNAIKHANATELRVEMKTVNANLLVQVADNGTGFDLEKERAENVGFGLRSLLRRTEIINGQMFVESKRNKGTIYNFEIPLNFD